MIETNFSTWINHVLYCLIAAVLIFKFPGSYNTDE